MKILYEMIQQKCTSAQKYGVSKIKKLILINTYIFSKDGMELIKCDSNNVIKDLYLK